MSRLVKLIDERDWKRAAHRVVSRPEEVGDDIVVAGSNCFARTTCLYEACVALPYELLLPLSMLQHMLKHDRLYCQSSTNDNSKNGCRTLAACRMVDGERICGVKLGYPLWAFALKLRSTNEDATRQHIISAIRLFIEFAPECLAKVNSDGWAILHATLVWSSGCTVEGGFEACRMLVKADPSLLYPSKASGMGSRGATQRPRHNNSPFHVALARRLLMSKKGEIWSKVADLLLPAGSGTLLHRFLRFPPSCCSSMLDLEAFQAHMYGRSAERFHQVLLEADDDGNLPLHVALLKRKWDFAEYLSCPVRSSYARHAVIEHSASTTNKNGEYPLELAVVAGNNGPRAGVILRLIRLSPMALAKIPLNDSLYPYILRQFDSSLMFRILQLHPSLLVVVL
uniref:Uncharacterized protein n=1 Tax=Grammatophora oceanica TaxID=210454 RepID=A0A7S1UPK3_9STRA|mmetsp:Transcript_13429/g.19761  ORF Transcript_13429/g.19761 Transcript_13429/m.19761 type:complete len:397 (+) Transcript_13429:168-1358(+)